jgi:hypothetical protein
MVADKDSLGGLDGDETFLALFGLSDVSSSSYRGSAFEGCDAALS